MRVNLLTGLRCFFADLIESANTAFTDIQFMANGSPNCFNEPILGGGTSWSIVDGIVNGNINDVPRNDSKIYGLWRATRGSGSAIKARCIAVTQRFRNNNKFAIALVNVTGESIKFQSSNR